MLMSEAEADTGGPMTARAEFDEVAGGVRFAGTPRWGSMAFRGGLCRQPGREAE